MGSFVQGDSKWGNGSLGIKWVQDQMHRSMVTEHILSKVVCYKYHTKLLTRAVYQVLPKTLVFCWVKLLLKVRSLCLFSMKFWAFDISFFIKCNEVSCSFGIVLFKRISRKRETLVSPAIFESYYNGPHTFSGPSFSFKPKGT